GPTAGGAELVGRIVLGAELAHRLRKGGGDRVPGMVTFTAQSVEPPHFAFKVVGLFRMGFNEYDTRLAYVGLDDARKIGGARESVFGVELRFHDPMQAFDAADDVKRRLGSGYRVIDWKELNGNLFAALVKQ